MPYDDATARRIDTELDGAYTALVTGVQAGNYDQAKANYLTAFQTAANLVTGGTNPEATANLLKSLGIHQDLDTILKQLPTGKLSAQQKHAALIEATGKLRDALFQAYAQEVPSPDEATRPNDKSLLEFRVKKLTERIR